MDRPGFLFCLCPDAELIRQHIDDRLRQTGQSWRKQTFWADEELPEAFWQAATISGLMGENRAVILRRAEALQASSWSKFHGLLSAFRPHIWLFFCFEKEWAKGKPDLPAALTKQKFWALAEKRGWVWSSPGLSRQGLSAYLRDWAAARGRTFSGSALETAATLLPLDAAAVKNELDKVELWAGSKTTIEAEDLSVLSFQPDMDIFAFLTALQSGGRDVQIWRKVLRSQMEAESEMVLPFLALILREARILWQLLHGEEKKVWMPQRVKQSKQSLARRLGPARLARMWTLILEAETDVKSGQLKPEQAFESLILGLLELFSSTGVSQRGPVGA
jgi:DNA polymerase-3 subunit delta